jgi:hypothetical protein
MNRRGYVAIVIISVLTTIALRLLDDRAWWVMPPVLFIVGTALLWPRWVVRSALFVGLVSLLVGAFLKIV